MEHKKARDGDPDEYIYDKLEDLGLPLGRTTIIEIWVVRRKRLRCVNFAPKLIHIVYYCCGCMQPVSVRG